MSLQCSPQQNSGAIYGGPKYQPSSASRDDPAKRCYEYHEVPQFCWEPFILSGYRASPSTIHKCLTSVFRVHNETVNIWTHLIAAIYFLWILWDLGVNRGLMNDSMFWPYLSYMMTVCLYSAISSMAHALSSVNYRLFHVCFCLDYTALSVYSFGASLISWCYVLPDHLTGSLCGKWYLPVAFVNSVLCTVLTCLSRIVENSALRKLMRLGAFAPAYIWANIPILLRVYNCPEDHLSEACRISNGYHINQILATMAAVFFYSSNIPERFFPGKFDLIGQSHNILHIFGSLATFQQMKASIIDMAIERNTMRVYSQGVYWSTIGMVITMLVNYTLSLVMVNFIPPEASYTDDTHDTGEKSEKQE